MEIKGLGKNKSVLNRFMRVVHIMMMQNVNHVHILKNKFIKRGSVQIGADAFPNLSRTSMISVCISMA
jgi:hypothetical protein